MSSWASECGTTACFAGHVIEMSGGEVVGGDVPGSDVRLAGSAVPIDENAGVLCRDRPFLAGAYLMDLSEKDASDLFIFGKDSSIRSAVVEHWGLDV